MHHDWGIIWHLFRGFSKKNQEIEKIKSISNVHSILFSTLILFFISKRQKIINHPNVLWQ